MSREHRLRGRTLCAGAAGGVALVLDEGLSMWGGVDPGTGEIIDRRHPQGGANVAGRVLVMPSGRGSSSSSTVLAEAVRAGTAPSAILLLHPDPILAVGALVAAELYGRRVPVAMLEEPAPAIRTGDLVRVVAQRAEATVSIVSVGG